MSTNPERISEPQVPNSITDPGSAIEHKSADEIITGSAYSAGSGEDAVKDPAGEGF
jgi:hypothetical protein